jgi:hypothetical protein
VPREPKSPEREQLRMARRLAASAERKGAIGDWLDRRKAMAEARGGALVLPDHTADVEEISARLSARARAILEDILLHSVSERNQLRAIELTLLMERQEADAPEVREPARVVAMIGPDQVEKVREVLVLRRALARKSSGE